MQVEPVGSAEAAVRDADLVCTTTSAKEPVLFGEWLSPGAHVNAVGACVPDARELDAEVLRRARAIVAEVGEVLVGEHAGRGSDDEITLFESLGLAVQDLAAARYVGERAREEDVGVEVPLGGRVPS